MAAGTITKVYDVTSSPRTGNGLILTKDDKTYFVYGHMSALAPEITVGAKVTAGQLVGYVGHTGNTTVSHLHLEIHPGGGHTWMLERAVGPQAAAAIVLFGEAIDGARAAEVGLAWRCHPDAELLDAAVTFAQRAAKVPAPLSARAKATLRQAPWQPDFEAAIATEVGHQAWSLGQGWFGK